MADSIWIIGGYGDTDSLTTSEYISAIDGSNEEGPDLPIEIREHAAIQVNTTTSMIVGGTSYDGDYGGSWFFSHTTGQWIEGPDLLQVTRYLSVGLVIDSVTQESSIVVTGGASGGYILDSVYILSKDGTKWISGKLFVT